MNGGVGGPGAARGRGSWGWPEGSVLGLLDEESRRKLLELGRMRQYPPGHVLIREGAKPTFVAVLLDGVVKASARTADARDALLAVRVAGDVVGELGVLDDKPRSATVTTCGTVVVRVVTKDDFLALIAREPAIRGAVYRTLVGKLRAANMRRIDFAGCDVLTRVARVLWHLADAYGSAEGDTVVIRWPLTQPELATLVGAAEPTVHKALRFLRQEGVVDTGYRRVVVTDVERLRRIAGL